MKETGIMVKVIEDKFSIGEVDHPTGEQHIGASPGTPLWKDAFDLNRDEEMNF